MLLKWFFSRSGSAQNALPKLPLPKLKKWKRFLDLPRNQLVETNLLGKRFLIPDPLSFYWSYKEIIEDRIYDFPHNNDSPRILDLGANCGLSALFFILRYPSVRLSCVEADAGIFGILKSNLQNWANEKQVFLRHAAVAGTGISSVFHSTGADTGRLVPHSSLSARPFEVKGVCLDDLIDGPVDFLKMDIEGAETDALLSSKKLGLVSRLFVEYHSFVFQQQRLMELLGALRQSGFRIWIQTQYCPVRPFYETPTQADMDLQLNLFAKRTT